MKILEVAITSDMIARAKTEAERIRCLNNSITHGDGSVAGKLGEEMVASAYNCHRINTFDYDLVVMNQKVEVKTIRTNVVPKLHYRSHLPLMNTNQQTDFYMFCRILNDFSRGWILGYLTPQEFKSIATRVNQGDIDDNGFVAKCHSLSVTIKQMHPLARGIGKWLEL